MADIATLGIKIETTDVLKGKINLEAFGLAADKVERTTAKMATEASRAFKAVGSGALAFADLNRGATRSDAALRSLSQVELTVARNMDALKTRIDLGGQSLDQLAVEAELAGRRIGEALGGKSARSLRGEDLQAYGVEMDRLRARFNPLFAAQQRFEAATTEINQAHRLGAISANEAAAALARETSQYQAATAAIRTNTTAAEANRMARGRGANGFATANIAAQFQDVGVTTAMGMSPMMIALQQGTQLSAALGNQGLKGTVGALGAAFASVLSPVSLLTIATIGLGAAGVQALMGMMNSTDDATTSLERHSTWLDRILAGYKSAREAANEAAGAASKLPQGAVESNLNADLTRAQGEFNTKLEETSKAQQELNYYTQRWLEQRAESARRFPDDQRALDRFDSLIEVAQNLTEVEISARSTTAEIDKFITRATELYNAAEDPAVRQQAQDMMAFGEKLKLAQGEVKAVSAAIAEMKALSPINIAINVATDQAAAAIEQLQQLRPELRSPGKVARDEAEAFLTKGRKAPDRIMREAVESEYAKTIAALDEMDRRAAALKASQAGTKSFDQWGGATTQMQQRIEAMQLEMQLMGQSTFEIDRQTAAFELQNQAKAAGIPLTTKVTDQISTMSVQYATATSQLEQQIEAQRRWQQEVDFARGVTQGFFGDLRSGMADGVLGWDDWANAGVNALNKVADRALSMAVDGIFDMLLGAVGGAFGGPGGAMGSNTQILTIRS